MPRNLKPTISADTDHQAFRNALEGLGLNQRSLGRLLRHLAGETVEITTINRWATGKIAPPPAITALLKVLAMLPVAKLRKLARDADAAHQD